MDNNLVYEWILQTTFTVAARDRSLQSAKPYLSSIIHEDDTALDLCCGSGFVSFWLEEQGMEVTGVDFAPYMIALAKVEAGRRHSNVKFIQADIFEQGFGQGCFDLVICFDSISDFPVSDFARLSKKVADTLKRGGRFAVKYGDGISGLIERIRKPDGKYQEHPECITFQFQEYLPDVGAVVNTIRNQTRREEYDRKGYIYTPPIVRLAVSNTLELEKHITLDTDQCLDIFTKT